MGTISAMLCRREITFMFLGLLTIGALGVSAQQEVPVEFQKCVTNCTDANGYVLSSGNYPHCDQCNDFVQCFSGNKAIQHCPLGTNYFNRKLGVCDSDINVCVNDSLSTTTATPTRETTTTTSTTSTTQETTTSSSAAPLTTAQVLNTTAMITSTETTTITSLPTTTASTAATPTTTTSTLPTTTITTTALPTTTTTTLPTTTTSTNVTLVTTTSTNPVVLTTSSAAPTIAVTASTNSTGYTPKSGAEADSFWFAIDLYNKNSLETMRAGAQTVDSLTAENYQGATYFRIYGVTLVQTACPNKPEFSKADYTKCPLVTPAPGNRNQYFVAKCGFKVRYTPSSTGPVKLDMIYMMCSK